jgi:chorismate mutase
MKMIEEKPTVCRRESAARSAFYMFQKVFFTYTLLKRLRHKRMLPSKDGDSRLYLRNRLLPPVVDFDIMSTIHKQSSFLGGRSMAERYYVVREDLLPEGILKTEQVKELLRRGEAATVHEAAERVGLSRSAFYKYKEGVYLLEQATRESIVTLSVDLEHRSGILSKVLGMLAVSEGNVLTIYQSIPLQGLANVVVSLDTSKLSGTLQELTGQLRAIDGVKRAAVVGRG